MSLSYLQLYALLQEIRPQLIMSELLHMHEVYDKHWMLTFRNPKGENKQLLVCLQVPFLRFHLTTRKDESKNQVFPPSLSLVHSQLTQIELHNEDRLLKLQLNRDSQPIFLYFELFGFQPCAYAVDKHGKVLWTTCPKSPSLYIPPNRLEKKHPFTSLYTSEEVENLYRQLEHERAFLEERTRILKAIEKQIHKKQKLIEHLQVQLKQAEEAESLLHRAHLLQNHYSAWHKGLSQLTVFDWQSERELSIPLDPSQTLQQIIERLFKRAKKLKKSIPHLEKHLTQTKQALLEEEKKRDLYAQTQDSQQLKYMLRQDKFFILKVNSTIKTNTQVAVSHPDYRLFYSSEGFPIWVGKGALHNEKLTFQLARGNDWWLHVSDYAGSHVILKGKEPSFASFEEAALLAAHYSQARDKKHVTVLLTQVKYVKKTGKPGAVHIAKQKAIEITMDLNRLEQIKGYKRPN